MDEPILSELRTQANAAEERFREAEEAYRNAAAQRDRLLMALQVVEELMDSRKKVTAPPAAPVQVATPAAKITRNAPAAPNPRRTIEDWAVSVLEKAGAFLSTEDLTENMLKAGFTYTGGSRAYDVVYSGLYHAQKKKSGSRIVNKNAMWGLKEWN